MKGLILIACFALAVASPLLSLENEWSSFKLKHQKQYLTKDEESRREEIFATNLRRIEEHNEKYGKGLVTFKLAVNKFADLTEEEMKIRNGYRHNKVLRGPYDDLIPFVPPENPNVPDTFDWRPLGAVTPIKDQGACGSCWTFSTTGALEGAVFLKTGVLPSISEQNLVDCSDDKYDNYGCGGGDMPGALQYVIDNDGIDSEKSYPYEGTDGRCRYVKEGNVTSVRNISIVEPGNEELLKIAVATVGPIAIAIDASHFDFQTYSGGVYYRSDCMTDAMDLDHAVLLVGYGTEKGNDYWLVKNSWADDWGDEGYIKMARNKNNNCGTASEPIIPLLY